MKFDEAQPSAPRDDNVDAADDSSNSADPSDTDYINERIAQIFAPDY